MFHVRAVKTASGATAVQVVFYRERKRVIAKHIGSARTQEELLALQGTARGFIDRASRQSRLFSDDVKAASPLVSVRHLQNLGSRYTFARETIEGVFHLFGFPLDHPRLLRDLVLMRVIQPASKLASLALLSEYFGVSYRRSDLYRAIPAILQKKRVVEETMVAVARRHFGFDFSVVFYDVTTLYFESTTSDALRTTGFSKDNKSAQPQIVLGLIVTREGFPVAYDIFEGKTFEGNTFLPVIRRFRDAYGVKDFTVVADAAMISQKNIAALIDSHLRYIVGARVANLSRRQIERISAQLGKRDGVTMRLTTDRGLLVLDFSQTRYRKDKRDMERHLAKADAFLKTKQTGRHTKFIKYTWKAALALNTTLIEKTTLLLGIKGYYTNCTSETDETIVRQYHNLWHVELAFRIAKSDLAMRPIYHFKEQTIKVHILICFMALAVCKYMELVTGKSTKAIIKQLKQITDVTIRNTLTGETHVLRMEIPSETQSFVGKLLSH